MATHYDPARRGHAPAPLGPPPLDLSRAYRSLQHADHWAALVGAALTAHIHNTRQEIPQ